MSEGCSAGCNDTGCFGGCRNKTVRVDSNTVLSPEVEDLVRILAIAIAKLGGELIVTQTALDKSWILDFDLNYTKANPKQIRLGAHCVDDK